MLDFIVRYWLEILFGLLTGAVSLFYRRLSGYKKMLDNTKVGVKVLLKAKITEFYMKSIDRGYITLCEKEIVNETYKTYQDLGGDAVSSELIEEINNTPVKILKFTQEKTTEE